MTFTRPVPISSNAHRRSAWLWAGITCASLAILATVVGFWPTASGGNLRLAASDVSRYMAPAMRERSVPFEILVVRDSLASSFSHDLALFLAPQTMEGAKPAARALVEEMHSPGAFNAVSQKLLGKCTVIASGEGASEGMPLAALVAALGDEKLAWRVALLHESAHCVRNIAAERLVNLQRGRWHESSPSQNQLFALFLSEAYADAYSMLAIADSDPTIDVSDTSRRLVALRQSATAGPAYRTEGAIRAAAALVAIRTSGSPAWKPEDIDRMALRCAIEGSSPWFQFMQIDPAQIAPGFIDSLKTSSDAFKTPKGIA